MSIFRKKFLGLFFTLTAVIVIIYFSAIGVPQLQAPVQIEHAHFLPDGGSFHIAFRDTQGKRFAIGAQGSLYKKRSEFILYTQRWWPYFPLPNYVPKGSETEKELLRAVTKWLRETEANSLNQIALTDLINFLNDRQENK